MMNIKRKLLASLSASLAVLMLASPMGVAAEGARAATGLAAGSLDYSIPYTRKTEIDPGDLLQGLLSSLGSSETVSEQERALLQPLYR